MPKRKATAMSTITWDDAQADDAADWRTIADEADAFLLSLEDEAPGARLVNNTDEPADPFWWEIHGVPAPR